MTTCNKCNLESIRARALKNNQGILEMKSKYGGLDVFVYPKGIQITEVPGLNIIGHPNRNKYFVAWFMKVPEKCEC